MPSLSGLRNKVNNIAQGVSQPQQRQEDDQSLATLLTRDQRAELTLLISQTTEEMRKDLIRWFDEKPRTTVKKELSKNGDEDVDQKAEAAPPDVSKLSVSEEPESTVEAAQEPQVVIPKGEKEGQGEEEGDVAETEEPEPDTIADHPPETKALKQGALTFFDAWSESVILRVGEVVNSREEAEQSKSPEHARKLAATQPYHPTEREREVDATLAEVYPPVSTPLATLKPAERSTIVNAVLLLLLSLEAYRAHSRVLLVRLAGSLRVSVAEVSRMEKDTAFGLLEAAAKMDASASTAKAQNASSTARKWKIGVAGVAGAALIGITGGLAAPLLAAGVGTLMGGLGLGATAAAGYLGALAGNAVLVGGLFGAYGARMTSRTMDKYAAEIEDFAFLPTRGKADDPEEIQKRRRRLRITVGVTGWLTQEDQVTQPWRVLDGSKGGEPFALRWELQALLELGNALRTFVTSQAWSTLRSEIIKRTILAAVWSALMAPLMIRKAIKLVDSPFGTAKNRAVKAGEVLADALIARVQGERPVSLIGQSLGARVVYACLMALARRGAFGLVEHAVLLGGPVPSDPAAWRAMRSVVAGRLVNVYSRQDYVLAFLYRTSSAQLGVAGIQPVDHVHGVENYDVTDHVAGHLKYMHVTGKILRGIGWTDLDDDVLRTEDLLVRQIDDEEKKERDRGEDPEKASVQK